jgi:hypothetical protein
MPSFCTDAAVAGASPSEDIMAVASISSSLLTSAPNALSLKLPGLPAPITAIKNSALSQQTNASPKTAAKIAPEAFLTATVAPEAAAAPSTQDTGPGVATAAAGTAAVGAATATQPALWVGDVEGAPPGYSAVVMLSSENGGSMGYIRNVNPTTGELFLYMVGYPHWWSKPIFTKSFSLIFQ